MHKIIPSNFPSLKQPISYMLNKNTLGVKKVRGQSEAALQTGATKNFDMKKLATYVSKIFLTT